MIEKIEQYVQKHDMLKQEDKVIVGVSGGADSICLLFVLLELRDKMGFSIVVVHVNHEIREQDAKRDEDFVKEICNIYHLPFALYRKKVELIAKNRKQSMEEAGREVRIEAFYEAIEQYGGTKIALAHHMNDNAETLLMNLARGTKMKGLGGIRPVNGVIIRPLLCVKRAEVEQYLSDKEISYCTDSTNATDDYTRNRVRNHMIPFLEQEVNKEAVIHINQLMEQAQEVEAYLQEETTRWYGIAVQEEKKSRTCVIYEQSCMEMPSIFVSMVMKRAMTFLSEQEKDITAGHLESLMELLKKQTGRRIDLPYGIRAERFYEGIKLRIATAIAPQAVIYEKMEFASPWMVTLPSIQCSYHVFEKPNEMWKPDEKTYTKWFDYDIIKDSLVIRTRKMGDYITLDKKGNKQKLKQYFINEKIPREERDNILLIAEGNHILWIVGYRMNSAYQINEHTKNILKIKINKGEKHERNN